MIPGGPRAGLPLWFILLAIAGALLWCWTLGRLHMAGTATALDRVEAVLSDWRLLYTGPRSPPDTIAIVAIDDATVAAEGRFPIGRDRLADLIEAIGRNGARVIAIDMLLLDASEPAADARLAAALRLRPTVIAAAARFADGPAPIGLPAAESVLAPLALFADAASVGLVNISLDEGGTPRHVPLLVRTPSGPIPSFVFAAAFHLRGDLAFGANAITAASTALPLDLGFNLPLRFLGPAGTVPTFSASEMLAGRDLTAQIEGRLVVVGATATAVGDRFSTPFDSVTPGVEILATGISHLLDGKVLSRDAAIRQADVAVTAILAVASVLLVAMLPHATGAALAGGLLVAWLAAVTLLFSRDLWFSAALPLAGAVPGAVLASVARQVFDRRHATRLATASEALGRFQPAAIARRIAERPGFLAEPRESVAAVLFIDLSGFTGLSEELGPAATRDFLKQFHSLVVTIVERNGGVVMSFMGDGVMIGFGLPDPSPDDAARARTCGFDLVRNVEHWVAATISTDRALRLRVGGHFGPVVLSRLGHDDHQHIAMTGDTVNVASRLTELGKEHGAQIVLSRRLMEAAGSPEEVEAAPDRLISAAIRGRSNIVDVALWTDVT